MKLYSKILLILFLVTLTGCNMPGSGDDNDKKPSYDYSPAPSEELSLKEYSRVIFDRFQLVAGVKNETLDMEFPESIYNKVNFHYPNAFEDVRLWSYDKPGVLVTGYIVEYNPLKRMKRLVPTGSGTALFGVEVVLRDNLSDREIARFSIRHPYVRPDLKIEEVIDETAKQIAGYLAQCRKR